jgi:hypothetical protein
MVTATGVVLEPESVTVAGLKVQATEAGEQEKVASATLPDAPASNLLDFEDGRAEQQSPTHATPPATPASSPQTSSKNGAPSLGDLGLTPDQIQGTHRRKHCSTSGRTF